MHKAYIYFVPFTFRVDDYNIRQFHQKLENWDYTFYILEVVMKIIENPFWVFYLSEPKPDFDNDKVGKWMYFFDDKAFVSEICKKAIEDGGVAEEKHSNKNDGVISFKLDQQTLADQYGEDFKAEIKLEQFIDLYTGDWIFWQDIMILDIYQHER